MASGLGDLDFEIIVVDNCSGDDILERVGKAFPRARSIQNGRNFGMGAGNNVGIRVAAGQYILILNPDTILSPDAITIMLKAMKTDPTVGMAGPKLVNPDGSPQDSHYRFPKPYTFLFRRTFLARAGFAQKHLDWFLMRGNLDLGSEDYWIMGSCLLVKKSVLEQVGLFDERFFMYFEDTDLAMRIRKAGFKVVYVKEAVVVHDHGRASAKEKWFIAPFKNKLAREHLKSYLKYFLKWGILK